MKQFSKKGFTLVEIMIVVVIIGLLAALAIPAFKKVRNNAIEKTLINDARQISSAANQYMSENGTSVAPLRALGNNIAKLSSGVTMLDSAGGTALAANALVSSAAATVTVTQGSYFYMGHANFDKSISSAGSITAAGGGSTSVKFEVDGGTPTP